MVHLQNFNRNLCPSGYTVCDLHQKSDGPGGGGNSHILAIRVCAAGKGMVFKPFGQV